MATSDEEALTAGSSAQLLPRTPTCPGTQQMLTVLLASARLTIDDVNDDADDDVNDDADDDVNDDADDDVNDDADDDVNDDADDDVNDDADDDVNDDADDDVNDGPSSICLPPHRCHDLPPHRCHDLPPHRCHDLPPHRCHDHSQKMTRALMLLIVAAAASSAAGTASPCYVAYVSKLYGLTLVESCRLQYKTDLDKFTANEKCSWGSPEYDTATCDPILYNYAKCAWKSAGLLKPDNTLDDGAFLTINVKNKCSNDANFAQAYQKCKSSTMQYLFFLRFARCVGNFGP
ncbi:uncharacterized protein LOC108672754 [Hyalella azteca]|uniref:Uncharacterized protein LOC108672754 n=1 Tax=Hyalella azteca TaxID=294128 RepID=A0A8B7NQH6_HYAAZ|nr:uncharacterized protein LOC108672754 [Hyalella azteca]